MLYWVITAELYSKLMPAGMLPLTDWSGSMIDTAVNWSVCVCVCARGEVSDVVYWGG